MIAIMKHSRIPVFLFLITAHLATSAWAQPASPLSTKAGDYIIHHTVFNSSFIPPEIAAIYGLTRGGDKAIVNVAVTKSPEHIDSDGENFGLPAQVEGVARNLMQQSTSLDFIEIQEQNATYYIAPFEFDDQEIMHFYIDVQMPNEKYPRKIELTKKLYTD